MNTVTDHWRDRIERGFVVYELPKHMLPGVLLYVCDGVEPGSFLRSMLEHNFWYAAGRADHENQRAFFGWFGFLYNDVPGNCHGSGDTVSEWIAKRGLLNQPITAEGSAP